MVMQHCDICGGTGRVPWKPAIVGGVILGNSDKPCRSCQGRGFIQGTASLRDLKNALESLDS